MKKKTLLTLVLIAITIIAVTLFLPQGAAKIPLTVSYTIGERMIYYTTQVGTVQNLNATTGQLEPNSDLDANSSLNYTDVVEVVDFDGETYTLNHTQTLKTIRSLTSISFVEKMHKTGYSTWIFPQAPNVMASNRSGVSNLALTGLLARSEVTVGDTWVIPVTSNSSYASTTGNVTLTFVGIQEITVPAGTYKVFRVDAASNDTIIRLTLPHSNAPTITSTINMTVSSQTYIEYNTGRQIERTMHIKAIIQTIAATNFASELDYITQPIQTMLQDITIQTQLIENLKPGENLTLPSPLQSPADQAAMSFLKNVVDLDIGQYNVQYYAPDIAGFTNTKYTLTSADNSLDVIFTLNNSRIFWCKLYHYRGSPAFTEPSMSNLEAAKKFLDRYQTYAQTAYVPVLRTMLDDFAWLDEKIQGSTFTTSGKVLDGEEISLKVSVTQEWSNFVWSRTGNTNPSDVFVLIIRNGSFEGFVDVYAMKGV